MQSIKPKHLFSFKLRGANVILYVLRLLHVHSGDEFGSILSIRGRPGLKHMSIQPTQAQKNFSDQSPSLTLKVVYVCSIHYLAVKI